jgi:hypothetical protein
MVCAHLMKLLPLPPKRQQTQPGPRFIPSNPPPSEAISYARSQFKARFGNATGGAESGRYVSYLRYAVAAGAEGGTGKNEEAAISFSSYDAGPDPDAPEKRVDVEGVFQLRALAGGRTVVDLTIFVPFDKQDANSLVTTGSGIVAQALNDAAGSGRVGSVRTQRTSETKPSPLEKNGSAAQLGMEHLKLTTPDACLLRPREARCVLRHFAEIPALLHNYYKAQAGPHKSDELLLAAALSSVKAAVQPPTDVVKAAVQPSTDAEKGAMRTAKDWLAAEEEGSGPSWSRVPGSIRDSCPKFQGYVRAKRAPKHPSAA